MKKIIRITTIPASLKVLLKGQLKFISQNGFEVIGVSSDEKELYELQTEEGIKVLPLNMTRKITPIKDFICIIKLYILLRKENPDIVHTHTPKAGLVGMTAAFLAGVPHRLHTVAGLPLMEATGNKRKVLNFVEKITYKFATKIYPNSGGLNDFIIKNKFTTSKKLKVLGNGSSNGINVSHFSKEEIEAHVLNDLRQKHNISNQDFVFIFVGRLVGDKGVNELVSAFSSLKHKDVKLLLVGAMETDLDPLKSETLKEIEENPKIIFVGFQKDVRPYFAISDTFVFPSYREGFPNVVMQAGAMELPSIVSNINGCNEIIVDGENGIIVPVKDIGALQKAMETFSENKIKLLVFKNNARKMIVERYEQSVVWQAYLREYHDLLKSEIYNTTLREP